MKETTIRVKKSEKELSESISTIVVYLFQIMVIIVTFLGVYITVKCSANLNAESAMIKDSSIVSATITNISPVENSSEYKTVSIVYSFGDQSYTRELGVRSDSLLSTDKISVYVLNSNPSQALVVNKNTWDTLRTYGYTMALTGIGLFFILVKIKLYISELFRVTTEEDRVNKYVDKLDIRPRQDK